MNSNVNTVNFVIGSFYTYGTVVNKIEDIKNEIINIKFDKKRIISKYTLIPNKSRR